MASIALTGLVGSTAQTWWGDKARPYVERGEVPAGPADHTATITAGAATVTVPDGSCAWVVSAAGQQARFLGTSWIKEHMAPLLEDAHEQDE